LARPSLNLWSDDIPPSLLVNATCPRSAAMAAETAKRIAHLWGAVFVSENDRISRLPPV
jgi:hypothetical protein